MKKQPKLVRKPVLFTNTGTRPDGKILWKCQKGHMLVGYPDPPSVCMCCKNNEMMQTNGVSRPRKNAFKHTLEDMQDIAKAKGGLCLSEHYLGTNKPLLWECMHGHRWEAIATSVIHNNTWCSQCVGLRKRI